MDHILRDRRAEDRFAPPARADVRATLRPGCEVQIVDVSGRGALVRAPRPLRPGGRVHLTVVIAARRVAIAAHVLRCVVWSLDASGIRYHGALRFDQEVAWRWAEPTRRVPVRTEPERGRVEML
jgi:hypothetical protein